MDIFPLNRLSELLDSSFIWPAVMAMVVLLFLVMRIASSVSGTSGRTSAIKHVAATTFTRQPILNGEESRLHRHLVEWMQAEPRLARCRLYVQVSLGEIVSASDRRVFYRHINAKRVDFVVVDDAGLALLAIEYQGSGHYGRKPGKTGKRDRIKKIVIEGAGIKYLALHHRYHWPYARRELEAAMGWQA